MRFLASRVHRDDDYAGAVEDEENESSRSVPACARTFARIAFLVRFRVVYATEMRAAQLCGRLNAPAFADTNCGADNAGTANAFRERMIGETADCPAHRGSTVRRVDVFLG